MYPDYLDTDTSLDEFLAGFEQGTFPKEKWTHGAHICMAASYILSEFPEGLIDRVRDRSRYYNICQGGQNTESSGYHETLTVFWLAIVGRYLAEHADKCSRLNGVRATFVEFGSRSGLWRQYYGFDVIQSPEARRVWIPPDLRSL